MNPRLRTELMWISTMTFLCLSALTHCGYINLSELEKAAYLYGFVATLGLMIWQLSQEMERERRRSEKITDGINAVLREHDRRLRLSQGSHPTPEREA